LSSHRSALTALKRNGRSIVSSLLGRFGMQVVRAGKVVADLREVTDNPVEAAYRAGLGPFLIDVPLVDCRVLPGSGFACTATAGNPFVDTLVAYGANRQLDYQGSPLSGFYATWQPRTLIAVLGLDGLVVSPELEAASPLSLVMPWQAWMPREAEQRWTHFIELDNHEHGTKLGTGAGWKGWGPLDPTVGQQEFSRLTGIYDAIERDGYRRSAAIDGDIKGVVLQGDNGFRVLVTAGHHRASALAALGRSSAPVRIDNPVIRRTDVAAWPNVRSNLFTHTQALAVFDRLFDGRQPPSCRWPQ
jgi:hypothetical protein